MSKTLEFTAKNVEKALEIASEELNIPKESIKHDVISYGSTGIFGLVGVKKAKIRVFLSDQTTTLSKNYAKDPIALQARKAARDLVRDTFKDEGDNVKEPVREAPVSEEIIQFGREAVQTIVDSITEETLVQVNKNGERITYNIVGGNTAVLIGKRGHTLEAIQYIVEKIINKKNEQRVRVHVDVEGYLDSRKENLEKTATKIAEKAKTVGKPMTMGQMNSHDRRIVHLHLKQDTGVRTQSIGEGYYRRLMIFPKRKRKMR